MYRMPQKVEALVRLATQINQAHLDLHRSHGGARGQLVPHQVPGAGNAALGPGKLNCIKNADWALVSAAPKPGPELSPGPRAAACALRASEAVFCVFWLDLIALQHRRC